MKSKLGILFLIATLVLSGLWVSPAFAQNPAYQTAFTTSITYQNVDTAATTSLHILFYEDPTTTTPVDITRDNLAAGAGTSVYIGSLGTIDPGFRGSAIMQADKLLVATLVQVPQSTTVKNRPLSNGFSEGSATVLLATALKNQFNTTTLFSVQNVDSDVNDFAIAFYNTSASLVHTINALDVQPGAAYYVDAGLVTELGSPFNGSVVITAKRNDLTDGKAIATAMELSTTGNAAMAFEGVASGATTFYMASALCNAFGGQNSFYAVQNTSLTTSTHVDVTYSNGATQGADIGPGAKASFGACSATGMTQGFSGSATIESDTTAVIAIGKVSGTGLSTGFLGAPSGAAKLAVPYVRWSESQYVPNGRQRTFLAIQNISGAEIPANSIVISYYDKNGVLVTAHTIATAVANGAKVNSNAYSTADPDAAEFGYYTDGTFGGSAIVTCSAPGCQLVVIARVSSKDPDGVSTVGEDYNGISVP